MSHPLHVDALATLSRWTAYDATQEALRQRYVAHLVAHPDGVWRGCLPDHLTAGALVVSADGEQVLLNLHRKAQRWFHFGGHCEPGDTTLAGVAAREAREESGIEDLHLLPGPVQLNEHVVPFCSDHAAVRHLDVRYVAVAPRASQEVVSHESLALRWWAVSALPDDLDQDMLELVTLAGRRVAAGR